MGSPGDGERFKKGEWSFLSPLFPAERGASVTTTLIHENHSDLSYGESQLSEARGIVALSLNSVILPVLSPDTLNKALDVLHSRRPDFTQQSMTACSFRFPCKNSHCSFVSVCSSPAFCREECGDLGPTAASTGKGGGDLGGFLGASSILSTDAAG